MQTVKECPACGTRHRVELNHEFKKNSDGRWELQILFTSQSINVDDAKLEGMLPFADDGQKTTVEFTRVSDREVLMKVVRMPAKPEEKAKETTGAPSKADMLTEAAETGMKVNPKWNDQQLSEALKKHKELLANAPGA